MSSAGNAGLHNVPEELRAEPRWVCWRREERGGKTTKVPIDASTGRMAKSTDPATWATFDAAVAACSRLRVDGVGFVFGPDRAFTGLDLDHVIYGGVLEEQYRWVVDSANTYCEVSPSGDGLHLIFRGSKPEGADRCRKGPVEMYDHERYFTVTGSVYEGHGSLGANPAVVEKAYRTWIEPERKAAAQATLSMAADGLPDDNELLERMYASRSGAAIRALMAGDASAQGGDRSAADMALCSHLAFWCGGDAARMDRIFRSSGLMRDKWDSARGGSTYGAQTVERASRAAPSSTSRRAGASAARSAAACPITRTQVRPMRHRRRKGHRTRRTSPAPLPWSRGSWTRRASSGWPTPRASCATP